MSMKIPIRIAFVLVALVNLAPVIGITSAERLNTLYGIEISSPNVEILLRHRAILFGIVGLLLLLAAFNRPLRPLAISFGLLSMLSFVVVAVVVADYSPEIGRVLAIDVAASIILVAAAIASRFERKA